MKQAWFSILVSVLALNVFSGAAFGDPTTPSLSVGAVVRDTKGAEVGTIEKISGDYAVVATGQNKVSLPKSSFAMDPKGPIIALTRAQLDAAAEKSTAEATAKLRAMLVPGVLVKGSGGVSIGTIKQLDGDFVVLTSSKGDAKLPVNAFKSSADGVTIGMTAADFEAAVTQAK